MADTQTSPELFDRYRSDIETALHECIERAPRTLVGMMSTHLGWQDEKGQPVDSRTPPRLHASVCLLACESLGGSHRPALPAAAAVELLRNFFLIHADVQEGSPERGGMPTVWWLWGPAQAINAGDSMYALARTAVLRLGEGVPSASSGQALPPERVLLAARLLDEACLRQCEGQSMDIESRTRPEVPVQRYLDMLARKAGALMGCAAEMGAVVAGGDEKALSAFRAYGHKLAVAQHVREDIRSLWGAPDIPADQASDFWTRRRILPLLYALEKAPLPDQRRLRALYGKRALDSAEGAELRTLLEQAEARAYAGDAAQRLHDEALDVLRAVPLGEKALADLSALARFMAGPAP